MSGFQKYKQERLSYNAAVMSMQGWTGFFFGLAETELENVILYLHDSVSMTEKSLTHFHDEVKTAVQTMSDEQKDWYIDATSDEHERVTSWLPRAVVYGNVLMSYSIFEGLLVDLCKKIDRVIQCNLAWDKVRDQGLRRPSKFLSENFTINCSTFSGWAVIENGYDIRNCVAHANGHHRRMNEKARKRLDQWIQRSNGGLSLDANYQFEITHQWLGSLANNMREFWPELRQMCYENDVLRADFWPGHPSMLS